MPIEITESDRPASGELKRDPWQAVQRGTACRCPACGSGRLFRAYLKVAERCPGCGEVLSHHRADDAPAYMTIFVVGHIVVAGLLVVEKAYAPPTWLQLAIWLPLTAVLCLALLPPIKGALVGLQWGLRMHGFGVGPDPALPDPEPRPPA